MIDMTNPNDDTVECWVDTHASLPSYVKPNERYPADVTTHAVARGSTPTDRGIAAQMASGIGSGQGMGAFDYLSRIRTTKDRE
jgi:hypothetical protein